MLIDFEGRLRASGEAACQATKSIPALLAKGELSEVDLNKLDEALDLKQQEVTDLIVDLLAAGLHDPSLVTLASKVETLWSSLRQMVGYHLALASGSGN